MGFWFYVVASISLYPIILVLSLIFTRNKKLPPSPPAVPILGNIFWLFKSSKNFADLEPMLRYLRSKYGNIVTIYMGSTPAIFITAHETAHRALVRNSTVFAGRPRALPTTRVFFPNQHGVSTSQYGPTWRLLRQNLMQIIHPSRLHSYSQCRRSALDLLKKNIIADIELGNNKAIPIYDRIELSMFALLSHMCFGQKFDEITVREIQKVLHNLLHNFIRFNVLNFLPFLSKIVFRKLWKELLQIRENQVNFLIPIIKSRREEYKEGKLGFTAYVDTLFDMKLPGSGRKLTDEELVSLCSEFLLAGTDTTGTTWLWAMANLVKNQAIQKKLVNEIDQVVKPGEEIEEKHLKKMPYLQATVLETIRRHPPGHFILPRAVTQDTEIEGYFIPRNAIVNFLVAELGWDPNVWEDPMEFKPERFLRKGQSEGGEYYCEFDVKGYSEIKMMPFGAGKRICPAISMALLHVEYFVANLVRDFKWTMEDGCEVDMTEKQAFTIVMKNPLRPCVTPRSTL
ncbi:hypothetical protein QN277_005893 [Acacia crassicarpa]|uniref:Cytochrome P450 n=1 Tax=Acacia crassicarpa TaxID=499986 RepID=A0AAE1IYX7_9FABA|nr:hypothetical protein QN277_005893 [Acacia crassicarpa]